MLNSSVSFFNISSMFVQTFVPSLNKLLNARWKEQCWLLSKLLTNNWLIAHRYLPRISAHLAFSSLAQKDDRHWGPSPDCMGGVVTPLTQVFHRLHSQTCSVWSSVVVQQNHSLCQLVLNVYFGFFYIGKTNRMTPFCNLCTERPRYYTISILTTGTQLLSQRLSHYKPQKC